MSPMVLETQWSEVIPTANLGALQRQTIKELFSKNKLQPNWDGYGSPTPSSSLINRAAAIINQLDLDVGDVRVVALPGGGVQVEWTNGRRELQLSFFPDETIEFMKLENGVSIHEGPVLTQMQLFDLSIG